MKIPILELTAQHRLLKREILAQWEEILDAAAFVGGRQVELFEAEFAQACASQHCVAVNSGTDALRFIFIALGLAPGDEVITTPYTFIATSEAITQAGGKVVFVDIDPATYTMDPARLAAAIGPRTKGIVPVHLYGQPAAMDEIQAIAKAHTLWVVEDACQAHLAEHHGRRAGSMGMAAAFSFYPGKNLGACGEGGAVTTGDAQLAATIRMLRDHGQAQKYYHDMEGYNGRCDALQAAALRVKLPYLAERNEARRQHASRYGRLLAKANLILPRTAPGNLHVFHLFVVQVANRDAVARALAEKGIGTGLHYPVPLHRQKAYAGLGLPAGSFPVAEGCAASILSLPMYPELSEAEIDYVCACLLDIVGEHP